jgi:hypothetical protein
MSFLLMDKLPVIYAVQLAEAGVEVQAGQLSVGHRLRHMSRAPRLL